MRKIIYKQSQLVDMPPGSRIYCRQELLTKYDEMCYVMTRDGWVFEPYVGNYPVCNFRSAEFLFTRFNFIEAE